MKAKKSLGQNFLKSEPALKKIIEAGNVGPADIILEIGPGKGALTKKLLEKAGLVIAVEKDRELFELLKEKFKKEIAEKKLILKNEDILNFGVEKILEFFSDSRFSSPQVRGARLDHSKNSESFQYKIVANIPYNITGAILKKFLTEKNQPTLMVLMVQQEVAQRIVAHDKKESLLSISVKTYGEPKLIARVPARYFSPMPKVDSAIILIKNISRKIFTKNKAGEEKFWELVKLGFAHKRKKLGTNLKNTKIEINKIVLENLKNKRAENLSPKDWKDFLTNS